MKKDINAKCEDRIILEIIMDIHNQDTNEILIYLTMCKKSIQVRKDILQELEKGKYFYWWYQYWF